MCVSLFVCGMKYLSHRVSGWSVISDCGITWQYSVSANLNHHARKVLRTGIRRLPVKYFQTALKPLGQSKSNFM